MKNILVVLLMIACSVWLLWIKLNTASLIEPKKTATAAISSPTTNKPKTEREVYQALSGLIRVFESDLVLGNLTPITTTLSTELPRLRTEDRYRIYEQLNQAIHAYMSRLNQQQSVLVERYAELQSQLWQQVYEQDQRETTAVPVAAIAAPITEPDPIAEQARQAETDRKAKQRFGQQWPKTLQQGLNTAQRQTLDALAKQQIDMLYLGEGLYELRLNPNYWVIHVAPHLAKADQVYLSLVAEQEQQQYAYDAGLVISWLELGQRVQAWARYVADYPKSYFVESARAKHDAYLQDLLLGMDNTPTHEQGVLLPEVKAAYAQLIAQYPNSRLRKTLQLFEQQLADSSSDQSSDVPAAAKRAMALAKDHIGD